MIGSEALKGQSSLGCGAEDGLGRESGGREGDRPGGYGDTLRRRDTGQSRAVAMDGAAGMRMWTYLCPTNQ